jgi:hypothetical protein
MRAAARIWNQTAFIEGTLGWRYFVEHRGLDLTRLDDLSHVLRWHDSGMIVALMTDPITGDGCGIHRTYLNADGTKRDRKMLGLQGVIRLSADEDVTMGLGICEGVEDGLAALIMGFRPVWVATSAGGIERFPVLSGIEALTIFADSDERGQAAAIKCAERWREAGCEVDILNV